MRTPPSPPSRKALDLTICLLAALLLALPAASRAENTIAEIGKACASLTTLVDWNNTVGPLPANLAGDWSVEGSVGSEALRSGDSASGQWINDKLIAEAISRPGEGVIFRSVTAMAPAGGQQVALWTDRAGNCRQIVGSFERIDGSAAHREMGQGADAVSIVYGQTASTAPTGPKGAGGTCAKNQLYRPSPPGTPDKDKIKWCQNGTCLPTGRCP